MRLRDRAAAWWKARRRRLGAGLLALGAGAGCVTVPVQPGEDDAANPRVAPRLVHELRHAEVVSGLDVSPDGEMLASASADGAVVLWSVATGTPLGPPLEGGFRLKPPSRMHPRTLEGSVAFSSRGDLLVYTGGGRVAAWDVATRKAAYRAEGLHVSRAAFSPDGRSLALATRQGLLLVDLASGTVNDSCATGRVTAVAFSPDGRTVATLGRRGLTLCRDPHWSPLIVPFRAGGPRVKEPDLAFSPDGRTIAWGGSGADSVTLVDTDTGRTREIAFQSRSFDLSGVHQLTFSPDGSLLAMLQIDSDVELWRLTEPPQRVATLRRESDLYGSRSHPERDLSFSADGRRLAYGRGRCTLSSVLTGPVTVRDLETLGDRRRPVIEIPGAVLRLSSSWRVGATAASRVVSLWDLE